MRYETLNDSFIQLPERSAILKNMDSRTSIILKLVDNSTRQIAIFPSQTAKYGNCDAYVRANATGKIVRLQITPIKITEVANPDQVTIPSGDGKYLPLSGGTLTGDLDVNADLMVKGKKIEPVTFSTDAQTNSMLNTVFGN